MKKVVIQQKRCVFDDFFKIEEATLQFEKFNGEMTGPVRRLNFERGDSVAALLLNIHTAKLIFVNQFRYPTYTKGPGWIVETIAGMVDDGEAPEDAMRREIVEETGYRVTALEHISTFYVSPGGSSERIILYFVEVDGTARIGSGGGLADENEDIQTIELGLDEALGHVASGQIVDAKTILGLFWLQNRTLVH